VVSHFHGALTLSRPFASRGARIVVALALALLVAAASAPRAAHAQSQTQSPQTPPTPAAAARAADTPPTAIPVAEVTGRADDVSVLLRSIDDQLSSSSHIMKIEQELQPLSEKLADRSEQTRRTIEAAPGIGTLDSLTDSWQSSRLGLVASMNAVTERANWLEQQRTQLAKLSATWALTRQELRAAKVPPELLQRTLDTVAAITVAQGKVETQRAATLVLQDRIARELSRADGALTSISQARRRAADSLFLRDGPPLWRLRPRPAGELPALIEASLAAELAALRTFVTEQADKIALHALVLVAAVAFITWARRRARRLTAAEGVAQSLAVVFDQPIAAALVLGMLSAFWIYADQPRSARLIAEIGAFPPMLLILRRMVTPAMRPVLYVMAALFLADIVRDLFSPMSLFERVLFLLEMVTVTGMLAWLTRSGHGDTLIAASGPGVARTRRMILDVALVACLGALVAGTIGNVSLAHLIGSGVLLSGYLALVLIAGRRLAEGLLLFALRVSPLTHLRMVQHHGAYLEERASTLLRTGTGIGWAIATLDYFGGLTPAIGGVQRVLGASLKLGAANISLGDVLAFVLTIYVAYLLSSMIQFVLAEDVFPRLSLRAGLPYALSSLVKYVIVFVGFLLGLFALGLNLDRVTVIGGALGVGVGFGLQNIVNNFFSGLIVLFERPIRVGDAVQIADVQGEVRRIGIRSTTVRSWEGAEVIVPNSQLVADRVTNWTPFDQRRRVEIRVGVAYGSPPDKVLQVLTEVAQAHPDVVTTPAPLALFLGFGDSALQFQLWAWTNRLDRFGVIKSELGLAIYGAFREAGFSIPFPQQEIRIHPNPSAPPQS
jgi:potassium-dependent mechanosensitive channel